MLQTWCCPNFTRRNILLKINSLTHQSLSATYQRTHVCIICQSHPYTINLNKMAPIAIKIERINKYDKYWITSTHKDLHRNPLQEKIMGGDEQINNWLWRWRIQEMGAHKVREEAPNPLRFHSEMDGFGRLKHHPSYLSLSQLSKGASTCGEKGSLGSLGCV